MSVLFFVKHLAAFALIFVVAAAAGTAAVGTRASLVMRSILGLAIAGQVFVTLGAAGWLRGWTIVSFAAIAIVVAVLRTAALPDARDSLPAARCPLPEEPANGPSQQGVSATGNRQPATPKKPPPDETESAPPHNSPTAAGSGQRAADHARRPAIRARIAQLAWIAIITLPFFVLALYPPQAFDETLYHLPFVRALATSGEIRFLADLRFPVFPELHEALCAPLFLGFGDTATHLVALAEIVLLGMLVLEWRGKLAAAICLGSPIVVHLATITYVEAGIALFVAAGFYCLDREDDAWAGFLLGTACAVKYHGGYFAVAGLAYLLLSRRRAVVPYSLALAAAAAPMYGRILALTGNPIFPNFGSSPWAFSINQRISLPTMLWDITFARERIGMQPPYSPLFAIALLITFAAAFRNRRAAILSAICVGYIAIIHFLPPDSRYLLPLVPLVSVAAVTAFPLKRNLWAIAAFAPAILYAGYRMTILGPLPTTTPAREQFFVERIPEYRALQRRGPGRIWVCGAEQLKYFGGEELVGDIIGPYGTPPPDTRFILVSRGHCPDASRFVNGFTLVYGDDGADLWQLESPP